MFVNQYLIIKDLGRGAHGTVKLVLDTEDQTVYAMKASCSRGRQQRQKLQLAEWLQICWFNALHSIKITAMAVACCCLKCVCKLLNVWRLPYACRSSTGKQQPGGGTATALALAHQQALSQVAARMQAEQRLYLVVLAAWREATACQPMCPSLQPK